MASKTKRPTKRELAIVRDAYVAALVNFNYRHGFVSLTHIVSMTPGTVPTDMVRKSLERMVRTGEMEKRQQSVIADPNYRLRAPLEQLAGLGE